MANKSNTSGWTGWVGFAAVMMVISGMFQAFRGFVSLFRDDLLVDVGGQQWLFDSSTWGWIHLVWGVVMLIAASSLSRGHAFGRLYAIFLSVIGIMINMVYLPFAPVWSVVTMAVYFFVLYAVVVHADEIPEQK